MKRSDWIFIVSVILYSLLFYKQQPGFNFMLFNAVLVGGIALMRPESVKSRTWLIAAACSLLTAASVWWYGNPLTIFANVGSLLVLAAQSAHPRTSVLVSLFLSGCSVAASYVFMIMDFVERRRLAREAAAANGQVPSRPSGRVWIVLAVLAIVVVFFILYRNSNVLFKELTKHINLDFISWQWCLFTGIGAVILYGYYFHHSPTAVAKENLNQQLDLKPAQPGESRWGDNLMGVDNERFSGILLFSLLNVLALLVNGGDILFQFGDLTLPEGISFTSYVHQGVWTLIGSIIIAILLVMFYFRGRLNFDKGYRTIALLASLWILQNVVMVVMTGLRNNLYTMEFGLTYKRVGVYMYLLFTIAGLITTILKVNARKTNTWLYRTTTWMFFVIFTFSTLVNWDGIITDYNLTYSKRIDRAYLSSLTDANIAELAELNVHPEKFKGKEMSGSYENEDGIDIVHALTSVYKKEWTPSNNYSVRLYRRIYKKLYKQKRIGWRSETINGKRVADKLNAMPKYGDETFLYISNMEIDQLDFYPGFSGITNIDASSNRLKSISEVSKYKNLILLDLSYNQLTKLDGIEQLTALEEINLQGNPDLKSYKALFSLPNLKTVRVNNENDPQIMNLKRMRPNLNIGTY
jgi:hypothetical protein